MFELHRVEERADDGSLDAVGIEWTESQEGLRKLVFGLMFLSLIAGTFIAFLVAAFVQPWWACMAVGIAMMVPIFFFEKISLPGRPRQLVFYRDGRMEAPLGFQAYAARYTSVSGHNSEVVSIEARQTASNLEARETPFSYGVVLYKRSGDVTYVAGRLHRDSAHKLAVQLTLALTELREDMASNAASHAKVRQQSASHSRSYAAAETLID